MWPPFAPARLRAALWAVILLALLPGIRPTPSDTLTMDDLQRLLMRDSRGEVGVAKSSLRRRTGARELMIGRTVSVSETFDRYRSVLLIDTSSSDRTFTCSGVLVAKNALITSPACFTPAERPTTFTNETNTGRYMELSGYPVYAGDSLRSLVGFAVAHHYIYNPSIEGSRISYVLLDVSSPEIIVDPMPLYQAPLNPPTDGIIVGYGPTSVSIAVSGAETPIGQGFVRSGNLTVTDSTAGIRRITDRCTGVRLGGDIFARRQTYMTDDDFVKLCPLYGDLGSPFLTLFNGTLAAAGVMVDTDGGAGSDDGSCSSILNVFVSFAFREQWIRNQMARYSEYIDAVVICPSKTPSTTSTASYSMTPSLSASNSMNVTFMMPPVYEPYPWWWIFTMSMTLLLTFGAAIYCCRSARARVKILSEGKPLSLKHVAKADTAHFVQSGEDPDVTEKKFIDRLLAIKHAEDPAKARAELGIEDEVDAALSMAKIRGEHLMAMGPDKHRIRRNTRQIEFDQTKRKSRIKMKLDRLAEADYDSDEVDLETGRKKGKKRAPRPGVDLRNALRLQDMAHSRSFLRPRVNAPVLEAQYNQGPQAAVKPITEVHAIADTPVDPMEEGLRKGMSAAQIAAMMVADAEANPAKNAGPTLSVRQSKLLASAPEDVATALAAKHAAASAAAAAARAYNMPSYLSQAKSMDATHFMPAGTIPAAHHAAMMSMYGGQQVNPDGSAYQQPQGQGYAYPTPYDPGLATYPMDMASSAFEPIDSGFRVEPGMPAFSLDGAAGEAPPTLLVDPSVMSGGASAFDASHEELISQIDSIRSRNEAVSSPSPAPTTTPRRAMLA